MTPWTSAGVSSTSAARGPRSTRRRDAAERADSFAGSVGTFSARAVVVGRRDRKVRDDEACFLSAIFKRVRKIS